MPEHIGVAATEARIAIVTGNPDRVPVIASWFDKNEMQTSHRGFLSHSCLFETTQLLVINSGIGAPSMAIVAEELIDLGIALIIRLGTCGAIQANVHVGDIVIPSGAIREEGTSVQYLDVRFPAVPDHHVLHALSRAARNLAVSHHVGVIHCKDAFYSERPDKQINSEFKRLKWDEWRGAGAVATEMESSALFVIGSLRRVLTGSVLINVGSNTDVGLFAQSLETSVMVIKEALRELANTGQLAQAPSVPKPSNTTFSYLSRRPK